MKYKLYTSWRGFIAQFVVVFVLLSVVCIPVFAGWTDVKSAGDPILASDWNSMVQASWDGSQGNVYRMTGKVGIGTIGPNRSLHIHDTTGSSYLQMTSSASGATSSDGLEFSIGTDASIWNYESGFLRFGTGNAEAMRILADGKIGIGTTIPDAALQVDGGIAFKKLTATPCGDGYPEGVQFYNDTDDYFCFCDGSGVDKKVSDNTNCFL